jgi:hypothetical protein
MLGIVNVIIAVLIICGTFVVAASNNRADLIVPGIMLGFGVLLSSFVLFNRATMLRLQAELALATRDIARNSFKH